MTARFGTIYSLCITVPEGWDSRGGSLDRLGLRELTSSVQAHLEAGVETGDISYSWYALRAKSRYENTVASHLYARGYESFLPLYKCRRRWSDRFKEIELPLFPGYVFCKFNLLDRLPVLSVPGVVHVVGVGRTPVPIDETEIAAIQATVKSGLPSQPWPFLRIGHRVRIEHGPLCGIEGILLGFRGHQRLVLSVTLLQRSVAVQVDEAWVRPMLQHRACNGPVTSQARSLQPTA
jgi:transcription antitermination factor NusG